MAYARQPLLAFWRVAASTHTFSSFLIRCVPHCSCFRCADVLTAEAVKFIQQARDDDRPFFLYLAPCECTM